MKGANIQHKDSNLTIEHEAAEQATKSISSKKAVNVKLESLKEIERNQAKQIEQSKQYLVNQEQILRQKESEVRHQALQLLQTQQGETRRKLEQAVDFALRSTPWWARLFWSWNRVMKKAVDIFEMIDSQTLVINIRDMKAAMDREVPGLVGNQEEERPAEDGVKSDSATVDTLEAIEKEEAANASAQPESEPQKM